MPDPFVKHLEIALTWLAKHPTHYIFPLKALEKAKYYFDDYLARASNDPAQIRKWHKSYPGCNWGIANDRTGLIPVDVDVKDGKVGLDTFMNLELMHGDASAPAFPPTFKVRTPSGGWHHYYNATDAVKYKCALGKAGFGRDVDVPNYVPLPGCQICQGGSYTVAEDLPIADAPEWFAQYLKQREKTTADNSIPEVELDLPGNKEWAIRYLENDAPPSILGRNGEKTLLDVAGVLKDHGISQHMAVELLALHYNLFKCDPPWQIGEGPIADRLDVKVENAYRYLEENAPGADTPEAQFAADPMPDDSKGEDDAALNLMREKAKEQKDKRAGMYTGDPEPQDAPPGESAEDKAAREKAEADRKAAEAAANAAHAKEKEEADANSEARRKAAAARVKNRPINEDGRTWTRAEVLDEWVYIKSIKQFVMRNAKDSRNYMWDVKAFDLAFCDLRGNTTSFSKMVLEGAQGVPKIRRFDSLDYLPGKPEFSGDAYNLWRKGAIEPKEGDTTMWDNHMAYLFPDQEQRDLVLNWIGWVLQHIAEKPTHALLLTGYQQGTGKSFIGDVLTQLLGPHNVAPVGEGELDSTFNEWALNSKLVIIEELQALDRGSIKKKLHPLITQTSIIINDKNVKRFKAQNCFAVMGMSNEDAAISINQNDRRYLVVRTHSEPKAPEYYDTLYKITKDPVALAAIFYQLKNRDLKGYSAKGRAPSTAAKLEMIEAGLTDLEHWCVSNSHSYPLCGRVVSLDDIEAVLPPRISKQPKVQQNLMSILRHRFHGVALGQCKLPNSRENKSLWGINKYSGVGIREAFHGKVYCEDRANAGNVASKSKASDFENADASDE